MNPGWLLLIVPGVALVVGVIVAVMFDRALLFYGMRGGPFK